MPLNYCVLNKKSAKLNIDIHPTRRPEELLDLLQVTMNEAWCNHEGLTPLNGVVPAPFHFDFVDVNDGTENARAFEHEDLASVVVKRPNYQSHVANPRPPGARGPLILQE